MDLIGYGWRRQPDEDIRALNTMPKIDDVGLRVSGLGSRASGLGLRV